MANLKPENEGKIMKMKNSNTSDNKRQGHSGSKHMWMMAICCGLPIIGFLAIGILGLSMPSLETLFLLICPIGMIGMMYMMHRDSQGKNKSDSCCKSEKNEGESVTDIADDSAENAEQGLAIPQKPGSLEA